MYVEGMNERAWKQRAVCITLAKLKVCRDWGFDDKQQQQKTIASVNIGSTSLYSTPHNSTMALLHSTWLYITLVWLYFTPLDSALF